MSRLTKIISSGDESKVPDFTPHELVGAYYDGMKDTVDFVQKQIIPVIKGQLNLSHKEEAVTGIFFRMHCLASSATRLNNKVDFNCVALIARTLFELLIDIKLLAEATDDDIRRFRTFPKVERYRTALKIVDFQQRNPGVEQSAMFDSEMRKDFVTSAERKNEIEKEVKELWGQRSDNEPNWPDHWTNQKIRNRLSKFGVSYEQEYLEVYSLLSWYVHAGSAAYAGLSETSLDWVYGLGQNLSRKLYIDGLLVCAKVFNLSKAVMQFSQVVDFLKDAPKQILIDYGLHKMEQAANS